MAAHWLTPDERRAWLALYALTSLLPSSLDAHLFREARITLFDYHVLAMLSESEDTSLPMSELAGRSAASLSRLSHVVKKLEARGWVLRLPSSSDGRVTTATLTPAGLGMLTDLAVSHVAQVRSTVFDALDRQDVADLERVGRKILRGMDSAHWILSDGEAAAEAAVAGGSTVRPLGDAADAAGAEDAGGAEDGSATGRNGGSAQPQLRGSGQ
ncbi:MarR family transcriptional regulator [Arthrobacter cheniae]|uniref:MarR family transcriptional regulator n=1 Tax=Arthrobacter cheniae TaxID=1258888 RepID=A0A3A5MIE2_9MICC|nr:MarR family transcriptional regulator [Arthrobacter cheniae]RJT83366.1 MarR family transcriptional regulator [Arthrobacter cheniae]